MARCRWDVIIAVEPSSRCGGSGCGTPIDLGAGPVTGPALARIDRGSDGGLLREHLRHQVRRLGQRVRRGRCASVDARRGGRADRGQLHGHRESRRLVVGPADEVAVGLDFTGALAGDGATLSASEVDALVAALKD